MQTDERGAVLVPTQLTWSEALIVLGLMAGAIKGPVANVDDPAIASLRRKMERVAATVEEKSKQCPHGVYRADCPIHAANSPTV